MDTTAADITFNTDGTCVYCNEFLYTLKTYQPEDSSAREQRLLKLISRIKKDGAGKEYDCIIGLSGGADSAYALYIAKQYGLRPLAVHMDNGWDSELAANNIANLVRKMDVDLYTHVIDWEEYKSLMQAFFDASVIDVELLYDNAMLAVNYRMAAKYRVKWILAGHNTTTEGMRIPVNWNWFKWDKKNIINIAKKFTGIKLNTFPGIGTFDFIKYRYIKKIYWISFLDYIDYFKPRCLQILIDKFDYKPYPYKHYESVFTRFYQGYILPEKFKVDKRILHLSTLVCSGQMTREEALGFMVHTPYPSEEDLRTDKEYFLKKMGWSEKDLEEYLIKPEVPHDFYVSEIRIWNFFMSIYRLFIKPYLRKF
jgi:N-acetyl sugar amidotransferase